MSKWVACYIIVLALIGCTAFGLTVPESDCPGLLHPIIQPDGEMQRKIDAARRFAEVLYPTVVGLMRREVTLKQASARVYEAALFNSQIYLDGVKLVESGHTIQEQIARNLIGHVQNRSDLHEIQPSPLPALESQLNEMIAELE